MVVGGVKGSFSFLNLCLELKDPGSEFPEGAPRAGRLCEPPPVGAWSGVVELPFCLCPCPLPWAGGGVAMEVLTLSSLLLVLLLWSGACFRLCSRSCRSINLFFTIILRLMVKRCLPTWFFYFQYFFMSFFNFTSLTTTPKHSSQHHPSLFMYSRVFHEISPFSFH